MYESKKELLWLQKLLDDSRRNAGKHLLSILRPMSAELVCKHLVGIKQVAMATVTSGCKPRVAPIDSAFIHGKFYLSTDLASIRVRHLRSHPAVSIVCFEGIALAVIVHGAGKIIERQDKEFENVKKEWVKHYGEELIESVGKGLVFVRVDPELMFTHNA
jgi:uncharacterized pyridoxamine 5'-phosphate oxidase family protein